MQTDNIIEFKTKLELHKEEMSELCRYHAGLADYYLDATLATMSNAMNEPVRRHGLIETAEQWIELSAHCRKQFEFHSERKRYFYKAGF